MNLTEVRKKARALGIKPGRIKKQELRLEIQTREGSFPCFATATNYCDRMHCCFREDCLNRNT